MASVQKAQNDSLSLATRYSLLRGRHLSMEKSWNERHSNNLQYIEELEQRNATLLEMLQSAQNEVNKLKKTIMALQASVQQKESNSDDADNNNSSSNSAQTLSVDDSTLTIQNELNIEYKNLLNLKMNKSVQRENLFYELLRECLFLSDPYNIRVLLKRAKSSTSSSADSLSLQSSLSNVLKLRKQSTYECDCFALHYVLPTSSDPSDIVSYSTRLLLMRNSLVICGVGIASNHSYRANAADTLPLETVQNTEIELYTIAGVYVCNNDPFSYCSSLVIACSRDPTIAAHGINPINVLMQKHANRNMHADSSNSNSKKLVDNVSHIACYQCTIFSDSKKLIHALTERLPDSVWYINNQNHMQTQQHDAISPLLLLNMNSSKHRRYHNRPNSSSALASTSSMVGRLGAGLVAGVATASGGMKGILRGIASGISGVAIKPITSLRTAGGGDEEEEQALNDADVETATAAAHESMHIMTETPSVPPPIHVETETESDEKRDTHASHKTKHDIRAALSVLPDSPLIPQLQSDDVTNSESGSVASSTFTSNTLDSSKSEQSSLNEVSTTGNNRSMMQSQIFARHKMIQRQQYIDRKHATKNNQAEK